MEAEVVLDTTVIIDYLKRRPKAAAVQILHEIKSGRLRAGSTSISAFEVYRGARLSPEPEERLAEAEALFTYLPCLPFNKGAAEVASEISIALERGGRTIEIRDLLIGAIAKAERLTLVTADVKHFSRIPQLAIKTPEELLAQLKRA